MKNKIKMNTKLENKDLTSNEAKPVLAVVKEFKELTSDEQQPYLDLASNVLSGLHCCTRVWEAWYVGTMTKDDFVEADFDEDLIYDRACIIYDFIHSR